MRYVVYFLFFIFITVPAICQTATVPVRHLVATNGSQKKIFKSKSRVLVITAKQRAKGYVEPISNDSVAVYIDRTDHDRATKIAIADIVSIRRLHTTGRVIASGAFGVGFLLVVANVPKIGQHSGDFNDAMVGLGLGTMFVSAIAIPVSFIVEKSNEKNMSGGWSLTVE